MKKKIIIGAGAAGLIAAGTAAGMGKDTIILEKNEKAGKKLYITGKGRCNLTNLTDTEGLMENIPQNPYFLYSAFHALSPQGLLELLGSMGLKTVTERGNRVFPVSGKASDVTKALLRFASGAELRLNTAVQDIAFQNGEVKGVITRNGELIEGNVLIATGGLSYPQTGSTGDGYRLAQSAGHRVTKLYPSLVPLLTKESWVPSLQGLSLKNVGIRLVSGGKTIHRDMGEMLFTHEGVSGPLILTAGRHVPAKAQGPVQMIIDLKPALDEKTLDARLLRDFEEFKNRSFRNALEKLLPAKLIPVIVELSGIEGDKKVNEITREERRRLGGLIKALAITITGTGGFDQAVVTAGGVNVDEIDPSTMESKLIKGLFFAGEVLDVDGYTGGFNLQIAFSTGYLAGFNI